MDSEDFDKFLKWLDPDPEKAAEKYLAIQAKLTRYFICRGCGVDAESLADETINRVIRKVPRIADSYVGDPLLYFLGVARRLYKEYLKKLILVRSAQPPPPSGSGEEKELLDRCLQRCLKKIADENRRLILRYYTGDKRNKIAERKKLAEELDVAPNAMRIRAHRIRTELRHCVEKCIEEENDDENDERTAEVNAVEESVTEDNKDETGSKNGETD
jgi:DNA-directed RNA polymerase specialized sigma24 family protein